MRSLPARICLLAILILAFGGCGPTPVKLKDVPPPALESGWTRFENKSLSLDLPPDWRAFDLHAGGIEELERFATDIDPQATDYAKPLEQVVNQTEQAVFAINTKSTDAEKLQFENLNLTIFAGVAGDLEAAAEVSLGSLAATGGGKPKQAKIELPIGPAIEYEGEALAPDPSGKQTRLYLQGYILKSGNRGITLGMSASKHTAEIEATFRKIAESLRVKGG